MWIITALQCISPEVNVKGVKNAMNETDDDVLWNGSEDDGNVKSECEEEEGNDREDGDSNTDW